MPRSKTPFDHDAAGLVIDAMRDGATLREACRRPGAPSWHIVDQWRRQEPGFDWYVRLVAHRAPPGASVELARMVHDARETLKRTDRLTPWSEVEATLRQLERIAAMRFSDPGPARPVDPADPETCF